jgi:Tol biopolymer transport system component
MRRTDSTWISGGIFRMEPDGSDVTLIAHGRYPTWSPDGSQIMFVDGAFISFVDKDGSQLRRLPRYLVPVHPSWQP